MSNLREWKLDKNFTRHARNYGNTTEEISINEKYKEKISSMIAEKQETLKIPSLDGISY